MPPNSSPTVSDTTNTDATVTTTTTDDIAIAETDAPLWVLNPHLRMIICNDDEILIKHGSRSNYSQVVSDEGQTRLIGPIARALRSPSTIEQLRRTCGRNNESHEQIASLLEYLHERGVVQRVGTSSADTYLDGVLGQGALLTSRIKHAKIAIVGAGTYGSHIAQRLASWNPKSIVIFDDRTNVQTHGDAISGTDAATRLADELQSSYGVQATAMSGALAAAWEEVATHDVVLACYEQFSPQRFHALNEAAINLPVSWLLSYLDGSEGVLHPVAVPGESPCYYELEAQSESTLTRRNEYHLYKDDVIEATSHADVAPLAAYVDVLGGMTVIAALRHLTGLTPLAADQTIRVDFERMTFDYQQVLKLPRCPACSGLRPAHRHLFL